MRRKTDNTRRIGGLLLDLLMLSFIVCFSFADVRIVDGYTETVADAYTSDDDNTIVVIALDAVCNSSLKHIAQAQSPLWQSFGSVFESPFVTARVVHVESIQYLYNAIYTNTTINAP